MLCEHQCFSAEKILCWTHWKCGTYATILKAVERLNLACQVLGELTTRKGQHGAIFIQTIRKLTGCKRMEAHRGCAPVWNEVLSTYAQTHWLHSGMCCVRWASYAGEAFNLTVTNECNSVFSNWREQRCSSFPAVGTLTPYQLSGGWTKDTNPFMSNINMAVITLSGVRAHALWGQFSIAEADAIKLVLIMSSLSSAYLRYSLHSLQISSDGLTERVT